VISENIVIKRIRTDSKDYQKKPFSGRKKLDTNL